jgi:hypothetical protein
MIISYLTELRHIEGLQTALLSAVSRTGLRAMAA